MIVSRDKCLAVLGLGPNATEEEFKTSYRILAKLHHPDVGGEAKTFMRIQESYDWLRTNHKFFIPSKFKQSAKMTTLYRLLDKVTDTYSIQIPKGLVHEEDVLIYFMGGELGEFRLFLEKGYSLPAVIAVNNLSRPVAIHITETAMNFIIDND